MTTEWTHVKVRADWPETYELERDGRLYTLEASGVVAKWRLYEADPLFRGRPCSDVHTYVGNFESPEGALAYIVKVIR